MCLNSRFFLFFTCPYVKSLILLIFYAIKGNIHYFYIILAVEAHIMMLFALKQCIQKKVTHVTVIKGTLMS